jgi:hypothetical protein
VPFNALAPVQLASPAVAAQVAAPVDVHVRLLIPPLGTDVGLAVNVTAGGGFAVMETVTLLEATPPPVLVHMSV